MKNTNKVHAYKGYKIQKREAGCFDMWKDGETDVCFTDTSKSGCEWKADFWEKQAAE